MEQDHYEVLAKHEKHWETLKNADYVKNLDQVTFKELEAVYKKTVSTRPVNQYCRGCVSQMIKDVYRGYDAFKESIQTKAAKPKTKSKRAPKRKVAAVNQKPKVVKIAVKDKDADK